MRCDDLEARIAVERAIEDQVLQRDRGLERVADGVGEPAVALETRGELGRALRMDEQHGAELLGLRPHRVIFRVGEVVAQHAAADRRAAQALLLDCGLELRDRKIGELQRERREGGKSIGLRGAELGQLLVVDLDDLRGGVAVLAVPERIDRQHLHVDRHGVHLLEPLLDRDEHVLGALGHRPRAARRLARQGERLVKQAMRVHVDGLDPLAVDGDRHGTRRSPLRARGVEQAAAAEHHAGGGSVLEETSACGHASSLRFC